VQAIYPFGRKAKFEKLLHDLKVDVLGRTIGFAADVTDEIDKMQKLFEVFGSSGKMATYTRQFSNGPPKTSTTHVNQMLLFVGALSFFWHAIDRLSFRRDNEALRAAILDPIVVSISQMLTEVLNKGGTNAMANDTLFGVQAMSLRYAGAPTLLGTSVDDHNCARWLAACAIVEDIGVSFTAAEKQILVTLMSAKLLKGLVALDLANRIKALEAVL
jgi:hypothetical protein